MTKREFLKALKKKLSHLPRQEANERLTFYGEMIDDRIEDGLSENDAVAQIGSADEIAAQILSEEGIKAKPKSQRNGVMIALLVLGAPIWFSLLVAAFSVVISLYVTLWALVAVVWTTFAALCASAVGCVVVGLVTAVSGRVAAGIALFGAALLCAGLAIFLFYGCKAAMRGVLALTKKLTQKLFKGGKAA